VFRVVARHARRAPQSHQALFTRAFVQMIGQINCLVVGHILDVRITRGIEIGSWPEIATSVSFFSDFLVDLIKKFGSKTVFDANFFKGQLIIYYY
jgi:hypothetical protein